MSNVEHLFENALLALENDYYFGEWKRIEKERHNTDGVSEKVIETIWELAVYIKYTYEPSSKFIPVEWIKDWLGKLKNVYDDSVYQMLEDWENENENR